MLSLWKIFVYFDKNFLKFNSQFQNNKHKKKKKR